MTMLKARMVLAIVAVLVLPNWVQAKAAKPALEVVVLGSGGPRTFGRASQATWWLWMGSLGFWWMRDRERLFEWENWNWT
jgi:hypothetical protein